ncbi:hypothetical protein [Chitinimonas taiwanensis]|nr:hypothetical protein [Chitinimonas taiwanensis]
MRVAVLNMTDVAIYNTKRLKTMSMVESCVADSLSFWSAIVVIPLLALVVGIFSIIWVLPKLSLVSLASVAIVSIPVVIYWYQMPRIDVRRIALFGRYLEFDQVLQRITYREVWVLGVKITRCWHYDQVKELVYPKNIDRLEWIVFLFHDGKMLKLEARNFFISEVLELANEYMPNAPSRQVRSAIEVYQYDED